MKQQLAKATAQAIREITLKDIYDAIGQIKQRQEDDFRHLDQKIDSQIGQVRQEIGQVRQEIGSMNQRIDNLGQKIDTQIGQVRQEIGQLNQRLDTIIQLLIPKQKES